jgi:uroporphyrinogen-III decarboxylase
MVSEKVWQEFVFPQLNELVDALAEAGYTPILHFDHDWTRDLEHLRALPARRCILQLDGMTDIRRAKEVLGDHMALMGDVPPALMSHGTAEEVRRYVEDLLRDVGDRGLFLAPGCDAPVDTRPENMAALVETGLSFRR